MKSSHHGLLRGSLLVAGTTIGGGVLALPVLTSLTGFVPSIILYLLSWFFMACTGLLLLEVCSWMRGPVNIVSMAKITLGFWGKAAAWLLYLFLFYCLTVAYIVGCGNLVVEVSGGYLPSWLGPLIFLALFAPFVYMGARVVGRFNILLMVGLGISYFTFVFLGFGHVQAELLTRHDWGYAYLALPIAFISFAYQGIVPTLYHDLDNDLRKARKAIIFGSLLPLIAYIIWQWLILGIIPVDGPNGLKEALTNGSNAVVPLKGQLNIAYVYVIGQFFAFFALVTSFFGVTLGLMDFLADGLSIHKDGKGKLILCSLIFIPPLGIALIYPHIFLKALDLAGGFGSALLLGLMPILMVWKGRSTLGKDKPPLLPGGKLLLSILIVFVVVVVGCEIAQHV